LAGLAGTLDVLTEVPDMAPILDLETLVGQTEGLMKEITEKQKVRDSLETAQEQTRTKVADLIREAGLCPLCGSPMDVAHFLEAVHGQ
jgi:DNA repair exonuclease SbcCD ATPase subunit